MRLTPFDSSAVRSVRSSLGRAAVGLTALAAIGGAVPAPHPAPHPAARRGDAACGVALSALERDWQSAGAWRALPPYPLPRDATPTRAVGVWLERWTLPTGGVELRRVSAHETLVARVADTDCRPRVTSFRRTYGAAAMASGFTDDRLRALVALGGRGMIYVWSPGMPLSVQGIDDARRVAGELGLAFTAVVADAHDGQATALGVRADDARPMESLELVYRGATVHYPAVVLYRDGAMLDGVIPGYKSPAGYHALLRARLADGAVNRAALAVPAPRMWVDHRARVTVRSSVPTARDIGFFFKPVAGTSLITYTADERAYLFDLATRAERRIPGHVDPVPTPDGRFLTRPGLIVYPMETLREGDTTSIFTDHTLPDEYQTASILGTTRGVTRYRIVTGWRDNARFRDYDVTPGKGKAGTRAAVFRAVGDAFVPCTGRALSLPISAKSGREFGAFDVVRGTNGIIEVTTAGACVDRLDLGFQSGKVSFSYDGKLIAFSTSRINVDTAGALQKPSETFYQDALLLTRASGRLVALTHNRPLYALSFPEFLPDGSVMLLDQRGPNRPQSLLRVLDVR